MYVVDQQILISASGGLVCALIWAKSRKGLGDLWVFTHHTTLVTSITGTCDRGLKLAFSCPRRPLTGTEIA